MSLKEAKGRRSGVLSFRVLKSIHASSRGGGNVEIAPHDLHLPMHSTGDFQGLWEGRKTALPFSGLSINRHFLGPFSRLLHSNASPKFLEQLRLRPLHPERRIRVADGSGDSL